MTRKINRDFMFVIAVAVFLTVFFTTILSYRSFQEEVFSELSSFAQMLEDLEILGQMKEQGFLKPEEELRITWIDQDGSVLYDSYADDRALDNHKDRPEIWKALQNGEGACIRRSQTLDKSIFFYAKRMEDGTVIRIAKEAGSIWNVYRDTLPVTLLIAALSFFIAMWLARCLTRAFIRPIEQMAEDMDHLEDVTAYKELLPFIRLIRSQHEEVLQVARLRQEFTANVSHELKTPLTSICGYAELIATGMASKKEGRHFAAEIHSNAKRLLTLIEDILKLSELEAGPQEEPAFETVDVYDLAGACMDMMAPVADKHEVSLSLCGGPLLVRGDKGLLEELLYNLCDNGIRYNRPGGHVWILVTDRLTVKDDGIGIPKRCQKRVFERFFRVDKSRSKKTGGTGLGLAIVKHIAEVHGAALSLESDEDAGTTITVDFPQRQQS
ncbi:MAG: two-component sensor histidine kinase [Lachnospiraceae bacterium]|nr:two-component sensor histidine kinase [Lachnospiraceae bacterium]